MGMLSNFLDYSNFSSVGTKVSWKGYLLLVPGNLFGIGLFSFLKALVYLLSRFCLLGLLLLGRPSSLTVSHAVRLPSSAWWKSVLVGFVQLKSNAAELRRPTVLGAEKPHFGRAVGAVQGPCSHPTQRLSRQFPCALYGNKHWKHTFSKKAPGPDVSFSQKFLKSQI